VTGETKRDRLGREVFLLANLVADRVSNELDEVCKAHGITQQQFPVLFVLCLSDAPEGVPIGSIPDGLINRASDVSRLVDRLEAGKFVERRNAPQDGRVVLVRPTKKGRKTFEAVAAGVRELHRMQWAELSDDELDVLLTLLNKSFWRSGDHEQIEDVS
jgi:DNA-binding MarR family transcriptional regulator